MQVHYDEGIANHIGPEPCVRDREGVGEASVGDRIGQPLSRESHVNLGADTVLEVEGNTARHCRPADWRLSESGEAQPRGIGVTAGHGGRHDEDGNHLVRDPAGAATLSRSFG